MIGGQYYSIKEIKNYYSDQIAKIIIDEVKEKVEDKRTPVE